MEIEAPRGPVGVPARLGRLPALRPEADRVRAARASATSRSAPGAPRRSSAASRRSRRPGSAIGWIDGDHRPRPRLPSSPTPTATAFELYYEPERYVPPEHLRPALKNVPQRYVGRGAAVKRIDHVNVLAADVAANRRFAEEQLGFRTLRADHARRRHRVGRLDEPDDRRPRADLRRRPRRRAAAACTTWRSSSTRARSCCAPPTCSSTPTSRSRPRRPSTPSPRGCSCTCTSRAATASR